MKIFVNDQELNDEVLLDLFLNKWKLYRYSATLERIDIEMKARAIRILTKDVVPLF